MIKARPLPAAIKRQLGKRPDLHLAKEYGFKATFINVWRRKLGKPQASRKRYVLPPKILKLLGRVPDARLARQAGLHVGLIRGRRIALGIKPFIKPTKPFVWTTDALALLGEDSDANVAKVLGIRVSAVTYRRHILGIPAAYDQFVVPKIRWSRQILALLGRIPDKKISLRFGIGKETVAAKRRTLGIPSFTQSCAVKWTHEMRVDMRNLHAKDFVQKYGISRSAYTFQRRKLRLTPVPRFRIQWTKAMLAKLGTAPDSRVAAELGITCTAACQKRAFRSEFQHFGNDSKLFIGLQNSAPCSARCLIVGSPRNWG